MKNFVNWFNGLCVALFCFASSPFLFAEDEVAGSTVQAQDITVSDLVSTSGLQDTLLTAVQSWVLVGISIAVSLFVILLGYRWIRRFIGR